MRLHDVLYLPNLHTNLISTNRLPMKGGKMTTDSMKMVLTLGKLIVTIPMVSKNGKHVYVLRGQGPELKKQKT